MARFARMLLSTLCAATWIACTCNAVAESYYDMGANYCYGVPELVPFHDGAVVPANTPALAFKARDFVLDSFEIIAPDASAVDFTITPDPDPAASGYQLLRFSSALPEGINYQVNWRQYCPKAGFDGPQSALVQRSFNVLAAAAWPIAVAVPQVTPMPANQFKVTASSLGALHPFASLASLSVEPVAYLQDKITYGSAGEDAARLFTLDCVTRPTLSVVARVRLPGSTEIAQSPPVELVADCPTTGDAATEAAGGSGGSTYCDGSTIPTGDATAGGAGGSSGSAEAAQPAPSGAGESGGCAIAQRQASDVGAAALIAIAATGIALLRRKRATRLE
jgi:hypothetical protein